MGGIVGKLCRTISGLGALVVIDRKMKFGGLPSSGRTLPMLILKHADIALGLRWLRDETLLRGGRFGGVRVVHKLGPSGSGRRGHRTAVTLHDIVGAVFAAPHTGFPARVAADLCVILSHRRGTIGGPGRLRVRGIPRARRRG